MDISPQGGAENSRQGGCPPAFGKLMSVTGLFLARRKQALLQRNFQGACRGGHQRQLVYAIKQLERLQLARKGKHVPAPVSV